MGPGGRWVRAAHTALSAALALGLLLHRTDLQKQEERGELLQPLIFVLLVLCSILLYFKVSLMDPGFVKPEEEVKEGEDKGQGVVIPQIPGDVKLRRCGYCLVKVGIQDVLEEEGMSDLKACLVLQQLVVVCNSCSEEAGQTM